MAKCSTYCCLEHPLISPIRRHSFSNLFIFSVWIHDPVLSCNLLLISLLVRDFLVLELTQSGSELVFQVSHLAIFRVVSTGPQSICLQKSDLIFDLCVEYLRLRDYTFQGGRRRAVG